ncbi:MAG: alpha/beta-hydrolase family protein [Candidatus Nanopelagicales bacterium]
MQLLHRPRLTEARRAGLLAAVAVYPLSRLAGTLPRPTLDRALVSGTTMAIAFQAAASTSAALRGTAGLGTPSARRQSLRTAAAAVVVGGAAAVVASRARGEARRRAAEGERLAVVPAGVGAAAELLTVATGAVALVSLADGIGQELPEAIRPTHPAVVTLGVVVVGAALGAAARHPRVLEHLTLPPPPGSPVEHPRFQEGATLPIAVARSAGVAALTVVGLTVETRAAEAVASWVSRDDSPGRLAVFGGHALIAAGALLAGGSGFAFYSSRVAVQEKLLEAAYAAVPSRRGVSGGPDSAYDFGDLGREGRRFVSQAHTADELIGVLAEAATDPVRAFLPLGALSGDAAKDAQLVVEEVERLGGFAKGTLVLAAPTGDGYVSYVQTETVELLTRGDCATVAVPYANVPSAVAFPRRAAAAAAYGEYAKALGARSRELNPQQRLYAFGESLGSIVALDAFGPEMATEFAQAGFSGGLYCGVPIFSKTDQHLRPHAPEIRTNRGLQYATGRDQAIDAAPGHLNLSHPTDPVAIADPSVLVRHAVDYWGRPFGVHVPLVSFLVHLFDVKNAMNLRPGEFTPSPGHDYRYDTAVAVARAYDLPFDQEEVVEAALRERELAWSVKRLLSKRIGAARDSAIGKLRSWGVDPETLSTRFGIAEGNLPDWLTGNDPHAIDEDDVPQT